jgi:pimeloyl-ACP methyl ester carboxylesterase
MRGLGYGRYGAGGGDFGAGVATVMALDDPAPMIGIHLTTPEIDPYRGEGSRPLSEADRAYLAKRKEWDEKERGYSAIQSTKPQTLGYGLQDSPAGLAAWILEKWRSWADTGGDLESRFSRDWLLTMVTIYWVTRRMPSSIRDYFDNRWHGITIGPNDFVGVPTGIANFASQFVFEGRPPREWFERLYNVTRFTDMPTGGHFGPAEEPAGAAREIAALFAELGDR